MAARETPYELALRLARNFAEPGMFSLRKKNKYTEAEINKAVGLPFADLPKNLHPGDKIYGLAASRVPYGLQAAAFPREKMLKPGGDKRKTAFPQILDDMWSLGKSLKGTKFQPNTFGDGTDLIGFAKYSNFRMRHSKKANDWAEQLNDSVLDMCRNRSQWDKHYFIDKHKPSLDQILQNPDGEDPDVVTKKASARFSKLGLVQSFKGKKKVHFVLDDIDMKKVTHQPTHAHPHSHYESITSKELRFIYRKQHENPDWQHSVKFYRSGKEVAAPWKDPAHSEAWLSYGKRSKNPAVKKNLSGHGTRATPRDRYIY